MNNITAYVKGDPETGVLGDCPFCHRLLITMEQKNVPYTLQFIDFANKPSWLQEKSGGKVPVVNEADFWLPDSDKIVVWLEQRWPEPSMKSTVPPEIGAKLFPAFREMLKCSEEAQREKEAVLVAELQLVNDYLASHGPFFGGDALNATDAAVAPKLHHINVALAHFKGWSIPDEMTSIKRYLEALKGQPAWQKSLYTDETMIKGWAAHMKH